MAERVVVDASAVLAVLYSEPLGDEVQSRLGGTEGYLGAASLAEVAGRLCVSGFGDDEVVEVVSALGLRVAPMDEAQALLAGRLRGEPEVQGLSVGGRASVALGRLWGVPVITTEKAWEGIEGVEVVRKGRAGARAQASRESRNGESAPASGFEDAGGREREASAASGISDGGVRDGEQGF